MTSHNFHRFLYTVYETSFMKLMPLPGKYKANIRYGYGPVIDISMDHAQRIGKLSDILK